MTWILPGCKQTEVRMKGKRAVTAVVPIPRVQEGEDPAQGKCKVIVFQHSKHEAHVAYKENGARMV